MNLREAIPTMTENYKYLYFATSYTPAEQNRNWYAADGLIKLRKAIDELAEIDFLSIYTAPLKKSALYNSVADANYFESQEDSDIKKWVNALSGAISGLVAYFEFLEAKQDVPSDTVLNIKLPDVEGFSDLSKFSNDLKNAIELPLLESKKGEVKIISAEEGSIWIKIAVGLPIALSLIAAICKAAAYYKREKAQADIFNAYARMVNSGADVMEAFSNLTIQRIESVKKAEAEAIQSKFYEAKSPEELEKLKNSIEIISTLMDKGARFLPSADNTEAKKEFPDPNLPEIAGSVIKQITTGEQK